MANLQYNNNFIPNVILAESIGVLKTQILAGILGQVSLITDVRRQDGETIKIPQRGTITAKDKVGGTDYALDNPSASLNTFGTLIYLLASINRVNSGKAKCVA